MYFFNITQSDVKTNSETFSYYAVDIHVFNRSIDRSIDWLTDWVRTMAWSIQIQENRVVCQERAREQGRPRGNGSSTVRRLEFLRSYWRTNPPKSGTRKMHPQCISSPFQRGPCRDPINCREKEFCRHRKTRVNSRPWPPGGPAC